MSYRSSSNKKPIIHSRESSIDSRTSSSSRSSTEDYQPSSSSRTSMSKGYYDVQGNHAAARVQYRRVPDNGSKYMESRTSSSSSGRTIEVHDHRKGRYTDDEPRASNATYEDYKRSQARKEHRTVYVKS